MVTWQVMKRTCTAQFKVYINVLSVKLSCYEGNLFREKMFIAMLTKARSWLGAKLIQPSLHILNLVLWEKFLSYSPIVTCGSQMVFSWGILIKILWAFLLSPRMVHGHLIIFQPNNIMWMYKLWCYLLISFHLPTVTSFSLHSVIFWF